MFQWNFEKSKTRLLYGFPRPQFRVNYHHCIVQTHVGLCQAVDHKDANLAFLLLFKIVSSKALRWDILQKDTLLTNAGASSAKILPRKFFYICRKKWHQSSWGAGAVTEDHSDFNFADDSHVLIFRVIVVSLFNEESLT